VSRGILKRLFESEDTSELRQSVEELQKRVRNIEEEWTETYNRFRTLQMRVAKQVQRLDANSSQEEPQGAESDVTETSVGQAGTSLSPRLQKIQREILARRARAQGTGGE
jgi:phage shock protein A